MNRKQIKHHWYVTWQYVAFESFHFSWPLPSWIQAVRCPNLKKDNHHYTHKQINNIHLKITPQNTMI